MLAALAHRGPDDAGIFDSTPATLGMTRLAILDLVAGHQPMSDSAGRYHIVFNGELYNYRSLRSVLERAGHTFTTASDTEVVLRAFIEFGDRCVEYFNGMFAFVIWDRDAQVLFGARDRIGIKPLYVYAGVGPRLVFAAELTALLEADGIERKVDLAGLAHYLSFEYLPAPHAAIAGVTRLPPATRFTFDRTGLKTERYWSPSFVRSENRPPTSWRDYLPELDRRLEEAVGMEMVADVPVGILLSGGLDSSTVAYYAAKRAEKSAHPPPTCFAVRFTEQSFDESVYAREAAKALRLPIQELELNEEALVGGVQEVLARIDEPFADPSLVPTFLLSRFARREVKVVLSGDGGDELFAGYPTYQAHRAIEVYERLLPRAVRARLIPWVVSKLPVSDRYLSIDFKLKRFLSGRGLPVEVRHHRWLGSFSPEEQRRILSADRRLDELDPYEPARTLYNRNDARSLYNKVLYCDMNLYLEGGILTKVDRATMANSLEARVPLLNHRVVSYVLEIPYEFKLRLFRSKFLLKMLMRGKLPRSIVERRKHGFGFPLSRLLKGPLDPVVRAVLDPEKIRAQGIFDSSAIVEVLGYHRSGRYDLGKQIWTLMVFQAWHDRVIGGRGGSEG
jgi:asparagine synthase (glutamine-hydrolysing)